MSIYDDYFTADDKPFAENLNGALLVSNVFDLTVPIELPRMFSNSTWVNSTSRRKAGVSIVTLKETLPNGVSVSTEDSASVLTGTGTVKIGFYPNFNNFGKFTSIAWTGTGSITVNLKTTGGSTIASNIANGTISSTSVELQKLQEIVIEVVLSNATLKTMTVTMQNDDETRYGAEVGITDVNGLDTRLGNIESKNTQQDGRLDGLEDIKDAQRKFEFYANKYNPNIDEEITIRTMVYNQISQPVQNASVSLYKNGTLVSTQQTNQNGEATWSDLCDEWGLQTYTVTDGTGMLVYNQSRDIQVNVTGFRQIKNYASGFYVLSVDNSKKVAKLQANIDNVTLSTGVSYAQNGWIPSEYRPSGMILSSLSRDNNQNKGV